MNSTSRRNFMKATVAASIFAATEPNRLLGKILPELKEHGDTILGIFTVKLDDYPVLKQIYGSVKITYDSVSVISGNIIVTRISSTDFVACSDVCPHALCSVSVYDDVTEYLVCPCHNSQFTVDGTYVSGPAQTSLTPYKVIFTGGDTLQIEIPGFVNVEEDKDLATNYLREFSPNIVIDNAAVEFGLASEGMVSIVLYDSMGNKIQEIANSRYNRGDYQIPMSTGHLSSGMYICNITTSNGFKADRKFTVVR